MSAFLLLSLPCGPIIAIFPNVPVPPFVYATYATRVVSCKVSVIVERKSESCMFLARLTYAETWMLAYCQLARLAYFEIPPG